MIYNINYTKNFSILKDFYLPAIFHPVLKGKKKIYQLSVPINGQEIIIKKAVKKFKYASFANVILGSLLRMKKLFSPDALDLGVILINNPSAQNLSLSFELVNKNKFIIANEEYILSIVAEYSYNKMETVTFFPVLYRQTCSNGQVAILGDQFKEIISVDKILEIGCEWTRCNFENYINKASDYFENLRAQKLNLNDTEIESFIEKLLKMNTSKKNKRNNYSMDNKYFDRDISIWDTVKENTERLGNNYFALYNATTQYASNESHWQTRNNYFLSIGRYLSNEIKKSSNNQRKYWSEGLIWQDIEKLASK